MKKVFLFLSSAMICAAMIACNGNAEETDSTMDTTATEEVMPEETATETVATDDARMNDIHAAAEAICNCGDILNCVNTVIDQSFAQYAQDEEFKAAVKAEAEQCIANKAKDKATAVAKDAAKDAAKKGLESLTK